LASVARATAPIRAHLIAVTPIAIMNGVLANDSMQTFEPLHKCSKTEQAAAGMIKR
jgi:hypothetical protein